GQRARGCGRGGKDIQALRASRTRLATGAAAVVCAGGLATLALARGSDLVLRIGIRGTAVALLALIAALVLGWPRLVTLALVLVGAAYGLYLGVDGPALDPAAPAFAAGLFLTAELAHWSLEDRENVKAEPGENLRRVAIVA